MVNIYKRPILSAPSFFMLGVSLLIYKQGTQTPLQKCLKEEVDSCYVPRNILQVNETLFVVSRATAEKRQPTNSTATGATSSTSASTRKSGSSSLNRSRGRFTTSSWRGRSSRNEGPHQTRNPQGSFGKDSNPPARTTTSRVSLWEDAEGVYLFRSELKELTMNLIPSTYSDCRSSLSSPPQNWSEEYNIEVSQNFFMLEEGKKKQNILTQYSKAFYGYRPRGRDDGR